MPLIHPGDRWVDVRPSVRYRRPSENEGGTDIRATTRARVTVGLTAASVLLVSLPLAAAAAPGASGPTGLEAPAIPLAPVGAIPGIDVSHHQFQV